MAAQNKTVPKKASVSGFLAKIKDPQTRADCKELVRIMEGATGERAVMWGPSIVGFGSYHYKYASGREGDMGLTGFSPRKQNLTIYIVPGFDRYRGLLAKLGKHKTSKVCLYFKRLDDVDRPTLKKLIRESVKVMRKSVK